MSKKYIVITGPTASGKTRKAVALARETGGEIISADSRQVYRGMDIGSGKDIEEYGEVPYHLIDIRDAGYKYNLYEYLRDEKRARQDILKRGKLPVMCGGTGLYVESVLRGTVLPEVPANEELRQRLRGKSMDELGRILASMKTLHNVSDLDTEQRAIRAIEIQQYYVEHPEVAREMAEARPVEDALVVGVSIGRDERRKRITARLKQRLEAGMIDEVKKLIDAGVAVETLINYGLEYKYITLYLTGQMSLAEMTSGLEIAIHQFAKRQMTWFRGMERRGIAINWLPYDMEDEEWVKSVKELMA